ncbi:hypothetical protein SAMN05216312_105205 [Cohnella sp. OV330]|uniref:hypothetical protein n=1 Tax=Cohnella sp. OV330 TaxID=1855288 RepID=UPI0008F1ACDE|nr:hypothetical protein [Cohnella sp. OV330]SFB28014.1 hypothetical protein SAMN05216312_105205 [Cohnella sp. OV330]
MGVTTKHAKRRTVLRLPAYGLVMLLAAGLAACTGGSKNDASDATASASSPQTSSASPSASPTPSPSASATAAASPTSGQDADASLLEAFKEQAQSDLSAAELNKALDDKLAQASPETGDALLREMLAYYDRQLPNMQGKFEPEKVQQALQKLEWPPSAQQIGQIKDEQARALVQGAIDGGYKLETTEGFYFPVVDYGKLKRADTQVTAAMKDYLALLAVESDQKSASDGGLVIERSEVVARAAQAEAYVTAHPDAPERDQAETLFATRYIPFLLMGLDNTPVFDFDTFKLDSQVKTALEKAIADNPGTVTAKLAQEFLAIVEKTGGAVYKKGKNGEQVAIPEVKAFYDGLEAHARQLLDEANSNK